MRPILNPEKMKAADNRTSEFFGLKAEVLMERAALHIADCTSQLCKNGNKMLLIAGPGNNGADAVAAFRILKQRGHCVDLYVVPSDKYSPLMEMQRDIVIRYGYTINNTLTNCEYDIIVDGLFGIGINRPIELKYEEIIKYINESGAKVISVDIASGLNADTGVTMGCAVKADITVTFNYMKTGMVTSNGLLYSGDIRVCDIGITEEAIDEMPDTYMPERKDIVLPVRKRNVNKGSCGKLVIIAGDSRICGAMVLCAKAAMRVGAGMVKVITHRNNKATLETMLPDALTYYYDNIDVLDRNEIIEECAWGDAVLIGPGLGKSDTASSLLEVVINDFRLPLVIDADGINMLAENRLLYGKLCGMAGRGVVLTPHLKEFERLTGASLNVIKVNIYKYVRDYCKQNPFTVVVKDAVTLIADSDRILVNPTGNQALAKAGTGDVLAGMIAGILVQKIKSASAKSGFDEDVNNYMKDAAKCGVYLHGYIADKLVKEAANNYYSLMASDLCEAIKSVLGEF